MTFTNKTLHNVPVYASEVKLLLWGTGDKQIFKVYYDHDRDTPNTKKETTSVRVLWETVYM